MRRISGHVLFTAIYLATASTAYSTPSIFARACAAPGFTQCSQSGLPADFCCGPDSSCIVLAGNTTVLCCPTGSKCATIKPISCDLQAQNNTQSPDNSLKTTALTGTLGKCGDSCCPFGYTCNTGGNCVMDADQSKAPSTSAVTSPTATSTSQSTSTSTTSPLPTPVTSCDKFPTAAILVGFFPGLVLGILLTVAGICILGARRRNQARRHSNGSSFGNISEPQPNTSDMRTDFLRKMPQTPSTVQTDGTPQRSNTIRRMTSMFRKSGLNQRGLGQRTMPGGGGNVPPVPIPMTTANNNPPPPPVTPPLQREPSYEDINIFADGDTASALRERERMNHHQEDMNASGGLGVQMVDTRASHQTTFSDMMERSGLAGLQKGQREFHNHV